MFVGASRWPVELPGNQPVVFDTVGGQPGQPVVFNTAGCAPPATPVGVPDPVGANPQQNHEILRTSEAMRLSQAAQRAYEFFQRKSKGKGIISEDGIPCDPAPNVHLGNMFEFHFDRPRNCVNIPRDLFPISGTDEAIRKSAIRHAASNKEEDVADMAVFIKEVRLAMKNKIRACVKLELTRDIRRIKIPYNGRTATTKEEVFKAWTSCNPNREMIEKIHELLYQSFPAPTVNMITYETYLHYGLWLDKDADGAMLTHKQAGGLKAKKCSIHNLVVVVAREFTRSRYSRKSDIPHGIILTISRDEQRVSLGRRKGTGAFDFRRFVKGWKSLKHIRYCEDRQYTIPSIPELDHQEMIGDGIGVPADIFDSSNGGGEPQQNKRQKTDAILMENNFELPDQSANNNWFGLAAPASRKTPTPIVGTGTGTEAPLKPPSCGRKTPAPIVGTGTEADWLEEENGRLMRKLDENARLKRKLAEMERNQHAMQRDLLRTQAELNERNSSNARDHVNAVAKQKTATQPSQKRSSRKPNKGSTDGKENETVDTENTSIVADQGVENRRIANSQPRKLPSSQAPEDDHVEINEILDMKRSGSLWQCCYRMESQSGKYEDLTGWGDLKMVFNDLEPEEATEGVEENLVIRYLAQNKLNSLKPAAKIVADLRKVDLLELFPFYEDQQKTSNKSSTTTHFEEIPTVCNGCNHTDYSPASYDEVGYRHHFAPGRKYSEARCSVCENWFETTTNQAEGRNIGALLPSVSRPVYACSSFEKDRCACGAIVCHPCFLGKQAGTVGRRRRTQKNA